MGELAPWHIIVVVLIAILLFGPSRLPDAARALGKSLRIFKAETRALREGDTGEPLPPQASPAALQDSPQASPAALQDSPQASPAAQPSVQVVRPPQP